MIMGIPVVVQFKLPIRFPSQGRVLPKFLAKAKLEDFEGVPLALPGGSYNNGRVLVKEGEILVQLNREHTVEVTGVRIIEDAHKSRAMQLVVSGDTIPGVHKSLYAYTHYYS